MKKYIDKSALVAEIEKFMYEANQEADIASTGECFDEKVADAKYQLCKQIRDSIDSLEVKEVDYERELSKYVSNGIHRFFPNVDDDYCKMDSVIWQDYVIETAKHFYELGLKAKGE